MTYSVYNINIDNQLSFTPGPTAGNVLAIDANGSTSWVSQSGGSGGSQTLEQTLALGNSAGTYSIVATSSSNLTRTEMNFMGNNLDFSGFQDNFYLVNRENKVGNHNFSRIILGTSSMRLEFVDVEYVSPAASGIQVEKDLLNVTNQKEIRLNTINSNIVLSDNSVDIFNNGATAAAFNSSGVVIPSITNSFLATNSLGQIIATASPGGGSSLGSFGITIDGGGSAITTGNKGYLEMPYNGTIDSWTVMADQTGSVVIDVWKLSTIDFPGSSSNSIAGTEKPTLSSAQINSDNSLTTWTSTSLSIGDIVAFNVDSASTLTRVNLAIKITKS